MKFRLAALSFDICALCLYFYIELDCQKVYKQNIYHIDLRNKMMPLLFSRNLIQCSWYVLISSMSQLSKNESSNCGLYFHNN